MPDQSFLFFFMLLDLVILAAVVGCHKEAIYSMAIIVFNSSVDIRESRVILAGAALCVHDGYGRRGTLDSRPAP
jgi:hypothetical protein